MKVKRARHVIYLLNVQSLMDVITYNKLLMIGPNHCWKYGLKPLFIQKPILLLHRVVMYSKI